MALSAIAFACLSAFDAQAQQAAAPADAASAVRPTTLNQVVITAQKRKEDVRKVPLSVSVVSGEAIQDNHINDITDLTRSVPNLSFS
ncbi:MAG: TonB-dependent receptor, partial [Burkholderiales bacterium]|nr:TonB-dependent receptor [Burkholderiales bacterium]